MRLIAPLFLIFSLILGGCDWAAKQDLKAGESPVSMVKEYMGEPTTIWEEPDGTQIYEYARGTGLETLMVVIKDGKYQSMTNVLVPEQFAKVVKGTPKSTVRRLLGQPTDVEIFKLNDNQLVWTYSHHGKIDAQEFLHVYFDKAGNVSKTMIVGDANPGGN
jgi:hypothetical protein